MPKLIRSLKLLKDKGLANENELQMKCRKCGERETRSQDGLCDHCRFDNFLTQMAERK